MRVLLMADRWDEHGDVEAEPVIASVHDGSLRLELDDGVRLDVQLADLMAAVAADDLREAA